MSDPSRALPPYLRLVRAPNPGPMTLEGTNTWLVGDPVEVPPLVVDPGPAMAGHLRAVLDACGGRVGGIVLTHRHADHAESAAELADRTGCDVLALDPQLRVGRAELADQSEIRVGGATVTAYATPGHTSDSCSVLLEGSDGQAWLLTGDTVLGRGTSVITHPDGDLGSYLASLARLQGLVQDRAVTEILPGHGPRVEAPAEWLAFYAHHRAERLDQVRAALAAGDRNAHQVVARVYADVDRSVWPAAEQSVEAQLRYLATL